MLAEALAGGLVIINITTLLLTVEDTSEARREAMTFNGRFFLMRRNARSAEKRQGIGCSGIRSFVLLYWSRYEETLVF